MLQSQGSKMVKEPTLLNQGSLPKNNGFLASNSTRWVHNDGDLVERKTQVVRLSVVQQQQSIWCRMTTEILEVL